jgi:tetratricopeptide (TPR) repeat protein
VDQCPGRQTRYCFHEIVRQYAREKLGEMGEENLIFARHLQFFLVLSQKAESELRSPTQTEWYARLNDELDNIRSALEWADQTDLEAGLSLSGNLQRFWESFDYREGAGWLAKFLRRPESKLYPLARAKALFAQMWMTPWAHKFTPERAAAAEECMEIYGGCGDKGKEIDGLIAYGCYHENAPNMEICQQALDLAKSLGDQWRQAHILVQLGWANREHRPRVSYMEQAVALYKKLGDQELSAYYSVIIAHFEVMAGNLQAAQKWVDEMERANLILNRKVLKNAILDLSGEIAFRNGQYEEARIDFQEGMAIAKDLGPRWNFLWDQVRLGYVFLRQGNVIEARRIFAETAQNFRRDGSKIGIVFTLEGTASLCVRVGRVEPAALLIGWADAARTQIDDQRPLPEQADVDRDIAACAIKMGKAAFTDACYTGRKMTWEEAFALALGLLE